MQKVSTKWVGTDSSKFWTLAGTENSTQWYSQYHGQVTSLPLSGNDAVKSFLHFCRNHFHAGDFLLLKRNKRFESLLYRHHHKILLQR